VAEYEGEIDVLITIATQLQSFRGHKQHFVARTTSVGPCNHDERDAAEIFGTICFLDSGGDGSFFKADSYILLISE
jgi:hypothetical protein